MRITRAVVPSLFTVLNMFCGFNAIVSTSKGDYVVAIWFVVLAGVFDSVDGMMARLTKSTSQFGVEIDSLSDIVSFGVAPSFIVYHVYLKELNGIGILISSLLMIFGGIRLARFNVQLVGFNKSFFTGLPIPASAVTVCSFILQMYDNTFGLNALGRAVLPYLVIAISLLMVSHVKYDTFPKFSKKGIKKEPIKFFLFVVGVIIVMVTKGQALFGISMLFVVFGAVRYAIGFGKHLLYPSSKAAEEEETEIGSVDL
ncbi:MAG: CDP-diacylglycerol--serine O-phosphatidyltransferase [Bacteroidota bacterium]